MTDTVLQEFAKLVAQQQLHLAWPYVLALLALSAVAGAFAGYGATYFRKRGETAAIRADLDELVRQSKEITRTNEEVKTSISQVAWASREARSIRRMKLEDLVMAVYEQSDWFVKKRNFLVHGQGTDPGPSSIDKVLVLANLYFPELLLESKRLFNIHLRFHASQLEVIEARNNPNMSSTEREHVSSAVTTRSREIHSQLLIAIEDIEKGSRSLMQQILELPKPSSEPTASFGSAAHVNR